MVKKPEHQWQTRAHVAIRRPGSPLGFERDPRAESFDLRFFDGRTGTATLGLDRQRVDGAGADDPDFAHAVRAWLAARGRRVIDLETADGTIARGPFTLRELGEQPRREPRRLVTLCPSNAELVYALGCFERVVACEDSSDYPPEVDARERLGPDLAPDLDRIAELAPDLVLSSLTVPGMERTVTGLSARGIPQVVLAPRSLADVKAEASFVAELLGVSERGRELVSTVEREEAELERELPREPVRVYLEWWPKPMFTPGADCYSNELIRLAGGINVFADRPGSSVQIDEAELAAADPDVCFVSWCGVRADKLDPGHLGRRPGLDALSAVREKRVYALDEAFSGRPGPRMLEAARVMARAIRMLRQER